MKYKLLNKIIKETNIKINDISKEIGISPNVLNSKLSGEIGLKLSEADKLGDILNLSKAEKADIFFGSEVDDV